MTQTYFPFDSGAGANLQENQWSKMAQHWLNSGVIQNILNNLEVFADSTGMQVKVKSGAAWIKGHYFESDLEEVLSISSSDITNPRIDRVILRLDWTANNIQLAVLQGTSAVSPTPPALTQNTSRWEISLAQVRVNANASTIVSEVITDERIFAINNISEGVSISKDGIASFSKTPALIAGLNSDKTCLTGVDTLITFSGSSGNRIADMSNGIFTAIEKGVYFVGVGIYWSGFPSGQTMNYKLNKNDVLVHQIARHYSGGSFSASQIIWGHSLINLEKGDQLKVYCQGTADATLTASLSKMFVVKVA